MNFTSSPFRSLIKEASPFFLMSYERSSKTTPLLFYINSQNIYEWRVIAEKHRKNRKKSDAFSNSIFEPYRAPALFDLETCASHGINFSPLSIIRENLKKISWVVSEINSSQNDTLKIRKSSISPTGSDVITSKAYFGQARPISTIPENFMKIRPGVLEKSSKKKNNNNN